MFLKTMKMPYDGEGDPENKQVEKTTYTKEEVEAAIEAERKQTKAIKVELEKNLNELRNKASLTAEEKTKLDERINALQQEVASKEELSNKEKARLIREREEAEKKLKEEAGTWQQRHHNMLKRNALLSAASKADAYNPEQIVNLLRDNANVVEAVDADGKPTGEYKVQVSHTTVKDGKPQQLKLTPEEALKLMADDVASWGNLFKSNIQGGVGLNPGAGAAQKDEATMDTETFMAHRAKKKGASK